MREPKYQKIDYPRLDPKIKEMNGKSTQHLCQCIDALSDLLDANDEVQHEVVDKPDTLRDTE